MEFLIIFISYLASGVIENNMIIRIFLTIIFSLAGIIAFSATKSFFRNKRKIIEFHLKEVLNYVIIKISLIRNSTLCNLNRTTFSHILYGYFL